MSDQLKWCIMLLFKCFEGFYFSDDMLCSLHLVSTSLTVFPIYFSPQLQTQFYILQARCTLILQFKKCFRISSYLFNQLVKLTSHNVMKLSHKMF